MKRIALLKKNVLADGLTLAQATDAVAKASSLMIKEINFSMGQTSPGNWALFSEPAINSHTAEFMADAANFVIDVPEADKIAIADGKVAKIARR